MNKALLAVVVVALIALAYVFTTRPHTSSGPGGDSRVAPAENPPVVDAVQSSLRNAESTSRVAGLVTTAADANAVDISGRPALSLAVRNNDLPVATLLLDHGADVNKRDQENWTPLMTASFQAARDSAFLGMVKLLLSRGADANASKEGTTALHVAVNNIPADARSAPIIEALLAGGAKPDGVAASGPEAFTIPPLQLAAWNGKSAAAFALVKGGASLVPAAKGGKTAAQTARDHGHKELGDQLDQLSRSKKL